MSGACGCRVEWPNPMLVAQGMANQSADPMLAHQDRLYALQAAGSGHYIVYCPLHGAAERLAGLAARTEALLVELNGAIPLGGAIFYVNRLDGIGSVIDEARALLKEIGR